MTILILKKKAGDQCASIHRYPLKVLQRGTDGALCHVGDYSSVILFLHNLPGILILVIRYFGYKSSTLNTRNYRISGSAEDRYFVTDTLLYRGAERLEKPGRQTEFNGLQCFVHPFIDIICGNVESLVSLRPMLCDIYCPCAHTPI